MDIYFKALISLILDLFEDYPQYTNSSGSLITPIFRGYDNGIVTPKNGNYIIITSTADSNMSLSGGVRYNATTHKNNYSTLISTRFNIDIYGNKAEENARTLYMLCQNSYANIFWEKNQIPCSIYKIKKSNNLSDVFGRDMYNKRFLLEVEIFNNTSIDKDIPYIDDIELKLNVVQRKI
jgi:hypothetical protein